MVKKLVKYSLLAFPLASSGLGFWQIQRLEWKKGLIADLERQMKDEPVDLNNIDLSKSIDHLEYRRVKARGKFDTNPHHQIYLKPRQLVMNKEAVLRGKSDVHSNNGVNVITPFILDGVNLKVLVNRGWLPLKGHDNVRDNAVVGLNDTTQELTGVLRKSETRSTYGATNNVRIHEWLIRDIDAMARKLNTAPIFFDLDEDPKRNEGPYGGQTRAQIRNEHLNYAITWFSLAVFSLAMWYSKFGKQRLFAKFRT